MLADSRFFSFLKNCFRNFPGAKKKQNFVPKGTQVRFEMAEKQPIYRNLTYLMPKYDNPGQAFEIWPYVGLDCHHIWLLN